MQDERATKEVISSLLRFGVVTLLVLVGRTILGIGDRVQASPFAGVSIDTDSSDASISVTYTRVTSPGPPSR